MQISGPSKEYRHDHVCMPIDEDVLSSVGRIGTSGSTWSSTTWLTESVEAGKPWRVDETSGKSAEHGVLGSAGRTILESPS